MTRTIDLSHPLHMGMATHPGLPGPRWEPFRTREHYRRENGTDFQVDQITLIGNTGTYIDSPFHRDADGADLAALPLHALVDLPTLVVDTRGQRGVTRELLADGLAGQHVQDCAVLLHTGGDHAWGTETYGDNAPFLTADGARWLAARGPALVGIDAVNIDDLGDPSRPAHTHLLRDGIPILEHLTALEQLPSRGARLHAAPPAWHAVGTWPVRVYALVGQS